MRIEEGTKWPESKLMQLRSINWCGNFALCNSFPSLFAFATFKEAWLVELWDSSGEEGVWSPRFSRPFNDWEVEEVERLLFTIRGRRLNPNLEDKSVVERD